MIFYDIIMILSILYYNEYNFKINYFTIVKFIEIKNIDSKRIITINDASNYSLKNNQIYYMIIKSAKKKKYKNNIID